MADTWVRRRPRSRRGLVLVLLPTLAALLLVTGCAEGEDGADAGATPTSTTSGTPSSSPQAPAPAQATSGPRPTQDEFCTSFLVLADANSSFASQLDAASGQALVEAARTMFEMRDPVGMTPGARVSLDQLVQGTLAQLQGVDGVEVDTAPAAADVGEADAAEFDAYLEKTCPD